MSIDTKTRVKGALYGAAVGAVAMVIDNGCTGYGSSLVNSISSHKVDALPLYVGLLVGGIGGYTLPNVASATFEVLRDAASFLFKKGVKYGVPTAKRGISQGKEFYKERKEKKVKEERENSQVGRNCQGSVLETKVQTPISQDSTSSSSLEGVPSIFY